MRNTFAIMQDDEKERLSWQAQANAMRNKIRAIEGRAADEGRPLTEQEKQWIQDAQGDLATAEFFTEPSRVKERREYRESTS